MKTVIIACPQSGAELEKFAKFFIKEFSFQENIRVMFALNSSNNLALEMFQKVKEQSAQFDGYVSQNDQSIDQLVMDCINKVEGEDALILRSLAFEDFAFVTEMLERKKNNVKVVYLKEVEENKFRIFLTSSAKLFAKYLYGIRLYDGSVFSLLIDKELVKLSKTFPHKTNMLLKTNSFYGYEKAKIEKPEHFFEKVNLYRAKTELIRFLVFAGGFLGMLVLQVVLGILVKQLTTLHVIMIIINLLLLIGVVISYSSFVMRRKIGTLR